jgi:Flp pilus assembly protein TadG
LFYPELTRGLAVISMLLRLARSNRGNVAMIFGISLIPLLYLTGMGVDYGSAAMREAQMNAIADAASLSAVTPTMMAEGDSASITQATNTFNAQAQVLAGVSYTAGNLSVTVADSITTRTVTVTYTASSTNFFPTLLGQNTIALKGTSQAVGSVAPNINFYLLLDDSPSMALPDSASGISTMVSNTQYECDSAPSGGSSCGCAFACHESNPSGESHCNTSSCSLSGTGNPSGEDNYALAKALGLTLRIDDLRTAVENLTTVAQTTETTYTSKYMMALYTYDSGFARIGSAMPSTYSSGNLSTADTEAANIAVEEVYQNNQVTSGTNNNDEDTNYDNAMNQINSVMPAPGNGTNATGDTPQEVLFIVTDGMVDESEPSGGSSSMAQDYGNVSGSRQQSTINPLNSSGSEVDTDWCTTIKNRGIRIAVLYTPYLSLTSGNASGNGWFNSYVAPLIPPSAGQDNIGARLQTCASPGLYYEAASDSQISQDLAALFQQAVTTAHLSK